MKDGEIVSLFLSRDPSAVAEAQSAYGAYCRTVAENILSDSRDVEECVNDAMMDAWLSIPPEKPKLLGAYLAKLTRNAALNACKRLNAQKRGGGRPEAAAGELGAIVSQTGDPEEALRFSELSEAISGFLMTLGEFQRQIFIERYWFFDRSAEIAERHGKTQSNIDAQLIKLRNKLKKYLLERGFSL